MDVAAYDLAERRDAAIALSGWSRPFTFYQPRNLAFWVYALLVLAGAASFVTGIVGRFDAYSAGITASVILLSLFGAALWWFVQRIGRPARQPTAIAVAAFAWGGFAATWALAVDANNALSSLYAKVFGQAFAFDWSAGLSGPFTEELAKGAGLVLLIALAPRLIHTAFDGFVLGAFIGLGFQVFEDVSYAMSAAGSRFGADQVVGALGTSVLRILTGVASHVLYSAVFCAGVVYLLGRPAQPRRVGRGLTLMASAILLHLLWNSSAAVTGGNSALAVLMMVAVIAAALVTVVAVYRTTVVRERELLRDIMVPELERGVITPSELEALCGDREMRRAYRRAGADRRSRKRRSHVLDAASDLAGDIAAAHAADTPAVEFARDEVARIRSGTPTPAL